MPVKTHVTTSLCMIVRNEEQNLRDCLRPVAKLFDEIVIVDTGSTDDTRNIALEFTSKVYDFPWCDDFAAARNEALRHAGCDWIFWLDADDRIPPGETPNLRSLLKGLRLENGCYFMTTRCKPKHECDGFSLLSHIRLFRSTPELQWRGRVHEQLRPEPRELGFFLRYHPLKIIHMGYADASLDLRKAQRNIRLLRMDFAAAPDDVSVLLHLAYAYCRAGSFCEAEMYLDLLSDRMGSVADWVRAAYSLKIQIALNRGDIEGALDQARRASGQFPDDAPLLFSFAEVLYDIDQYQSCIGVLRHVLRLPEPKVVHGIAKGDITTKLAPLLLSECYREVGKLKESIHLARSLLERFPGDHRISHALGLTLLLDGQRSKVTALRRKMEMQPYGEVFSLLLHIVDGLLRNELGDLERSLERVISLAPRMARPRILRVEFLRQRNAPLSDYLAACRDVLRVCPGHQVIRQNVNQIEQFLATVVETPQSVS